MDWEIPDGVDRCPTCGRFVEIGEGYADLPPGGIANVDYVATYCDADCAERKPVRCMYEEEVFEHPQASVADLRALLR